MATRASHEEPGLRSHQSPSVSACSPEVWLSSWLTVASATGTRRDFLATGTGAMLAIAGLAQWAANWAVTVAVALSALVLGLGHAVLIAQNFHGRVQKIRGQSAIQIGQGALDEPPVDVEKDAAEECNSDEKYNENDQKCGESHRATRFDVKSGTKCSAYSTPIGPILVRQRPGIIRKIRCCSPHFMRCLLYTSPSPRD